LIPALDSPNLVLAPAVASNRVLQHQHSFQLPILEFNLLGELFAFNVLRLFKLVLIVADDDHLGFLAGFLPPPDLLELHRSNNLFVRLDFVIEASLNLVEQPQVLLVQCV